MASVLFALSAKAVDAPLVPDPPSPNPPHEQGFLFGGFDIAHGSKSLWSGIVGAPWSLLDEDGPRFRLMAGHSRYSYRSGSVAGGKNDGAGTSGEFMLGWYSSFQPLYISAYLGPHVENHHLRKRDPKNRVKGTKFGIKGLFELYARLHTHLIATASVSASSVNRHYHLRGALAHEFIPGLSSGLEGALLGDRRYSEPRIGLLMKKKFDRRTITLAGGLLSNSDKGRGGYLTMSLYAPY